MKVAIIGSRGITNVDMKKYIPPNTTEIISGDARGVDSIAKQYAQENNIKLVEYLPEYKLYGRGAPLKGNIKIIERADLVIAFWDGTSRGTKFVIEKCRKMNIPIKIFQKPLDK